MSVECLSNTVIWVTLELVICYRFKLKSGYWLCSHRSVYVCHVVTMYEIVSNTLNVVNCCNSLLCFFLLIGEHKSVVNEHCGCYV